MAHLIPCSFSRYRLTPEEEVTGTLLSAEQTYVIQNKLVEISEQILALDYQASSPSDFLQNEAFLKGQLAFARFLLESSETIRANLNQE